MAVALGIAVMYLGALIDVIDLTVAAVASLLMVFIYVEIGRPYTYLVWIGTSLLAFLLFPQSLLWLEYFLLFGSWPILKGFVERLPRLAWIPVKFAIFNALLWVCVGLCGLILGVPFFDGETQLWNVLLYLLCNVTFFVYDFFLTVMARLYFARFRQKVMRLLK